MKGRSSRPPSKPKTGKQLSLITTEPGDFFRQQISTALANQKVKADPSTEAYLVDLLIRFMISDNLYAVDPEGGRRHEEVLALLLNEAVSSSNQTERRQGLRRIGDVSLYTAGFFADSLARKIVDVDYYIGMGRSAYGSLAQMGYSQVIFSELAQKFSKFVDILGEVSAQAGTSDPQNILRLYELWLRTNSQRAEKGLKQAGIIPTAEIKKKWKQ